ncbi:MAG: YbjQ family protein [Synergistaceae bacterium]|jgi:uncharacterized protein YbjQ (UPF0145 family)|nr:YbjQ family protein [Synergistaceae bacterium]
MELPPWELEEQEKWQQQKAAQQKALDAAPKRGSKLVVTTAETIGGKKFTTAGIVLGAVVYVGNLTAETQNFYASGAIGGELTGAAAMFAEARKTALERMMDEARELKADAVIAVRFQTTEIMQTVVELLAYGTAVTFMNA